MNKIYKHVMIFDGSYAIHRALNVPELFNLRNPFTGERTGGVYGTLKIIFSELEKNNTYFPIVVFDNGLASRRLNADPSYKHADIRNNDTSLLTPEELDNDYVTQYRKQRNKLCEMLPYFGIPVLKYKGWEGDDLQKIVSDLTEDTLIVTDDKDMLQLLNKNCRIRRAMADELWTESEFIASHGFDDISDFIIWKAINGDKSDNIPGSCKGVGNASINAFIKIIKSMRNIDGTFDFSNYPKDIDTMKAYCTSLDVPYKKAYLNFDSTRFLINIELVDLNKVLLDCTDEFIESIKATIENDSECTDYFKAVAALNDMAIKYFPADEFISMIAIRKSNLV